MSLKSSARIKKRRSAEAAAANAASTSNVAAPASTTATYRIQSTGYISSNSHLTNINTNPPQQVISKKQHFVGRNPNFDTDETKLLIQLWGDPKLQRTLITTHKKHAVICQLAGKMQEYGYHRSPEEITTRIKNLKCFYNRLKKDKECGLTGEADPSWKHFAEMDAIMTRPIFSVRPNEVPAPSLKYQLEQAMEEHAERRKRRQQNGEEVSDSENEEDDMMLSSLVANGKSKADAHAEADEDVGQMDIGEDAISGSKRRRISSDPEGDVDIDEATATYTRIKTELDPVPEINGDSLAGSAAQDDDCVVLPPPPKEEPIDVDAAEDVESPTGLNPNMPSLTRAIMPTLADMLQLPKTTSLLPYSGANVMIPANSISTSAAGTISTSNVTTNGNMSAGKISLVPTNFLMQPKQTLAAAPSKSINMGVATPAGAQLQLLQSAINSGARLMISNGAAPAPVPAVTNTAMRIMLRQLLNAQNEANEIQHNRLALERERLDFEKTVGERLLSMLPSLLQPAATAAAAATPASAVPTTTSQFVVSNATGAQRLQPPKLLFTTALPVANGTHMGTPSSAMSASLPKAPTAPVATTSNNNSGAADISPQLNDVELVTPKLENEV
ncbi:CG10151 [Drosophila busckii]|uniref:CG10151 n=1 Tax=Drosophila busckii TaxID=30019 RepID=A0A0M3QV55_DROBS|nr:CG10151 [Drosophila busckii]